MLRPYPKYVNRVANPTNTPIQNTISAQIFVALIHNGLVKFGAMLCDLVLDRNSFAYEIITSIFILSIQNKIKIEYFTFNYPIVIQPSINTMRDTTVNIDQERQTPRKTYEPCRTIIWITLLSVSLFLFVTLLPLSFVYIRYNEMAFRRNKFGRVETDTVLEQGRHYLPLTYELVKFPRTFQRISFLHEDGTALTVFTRDGYQISIEVQFYYRLLPENLSLVYGLYSTSYETGVSNLAKLTVRELSGSASSGIYLPLQSYIDNRTYIASAYASEINKRMREQLSVDVPVDTFKIIEIGIPEDMITRYRQTVVQLQNNEVSANMQQVLAIQAQTDRLVSVISAETNMTLISANINAEFIKKNAEYAANNAINNADVDGFNMLCQTLNITDHNDILSLYKVLNIISNPATKLFHNLAGISLIV